MAFLRWLTKTGAKWALVGLAVKVSVDNDVWSLRTDVGESVYDKLKKNIVTGTIVFKEELPSCDEVQNEYGGRWNRNVNRVFNSINDSSSTVCSKINEWVTHSS